jgi:hypothetical protein
MNSLSQRDAVNVARQGRQQETRKIIEINDSEGLKGEDERA